VHHPGGRLRRLHGRPGVPAHQLLGGPVSGSTFVSGAAAWSRANRYPAVIAGLSNETRSLTAMNVPSSPPRRVPGPPQGAQVAVPYARETDRCTPVSTASSTTLGPAAALPFKPALGRTTVITATTIRYAPIAPVKM